MPLYEYRCDNCNQTFELIQKFSDEPLTVHEKCGGPVHRLISAPALQFKGSGWYITDYAKGGGTPADSPSANGSSGDSAGKADSGTKAESGGKSDSGAKSDTSSGSSSTSTTTPSSTSGSSSDKK